MLKKLIQTDKNNLAALFTRVAIAIAVFPHGAQKLLGWYGGGGFEKTMYFMTQIKNLPWILGFLVIIIEFFGAILLAAGLHTRLMALFLTLNFIGIILVDTWGNGFFMNWAGVEGKGEGYEYFILLFGLLISSFIMGGGKASLDAMMQKNNRN